MTQWNDVRMEQVIGRLLKSGVMIASAVVVIGAVCLLIGQPHAPASFHRFTATPRSYRTIAGIFNALTQFDCRAMIQLGLLLLIATPVARVAFSLVAFALERDRIYVVITVLVLGILLYSLLLEH